MKTTHLHATTKTMLLLMPVQSSIQYSKRKERIVKQSATTFVYKDKCKIKKLSIQDAVKYIKGKNSKYLMYTRKVNNRRTQTALCDIHSISDILKEQYTIEEAARIIGTNKKELKQMCIDKLVEHKIINNQMYITKYETKCLLELIRGS